MLDASKGAGKAPSRDSRLKCSNNHLASIIVSAWKKGYIFICLFAESGVYPV